MGLPLILCVGIATLDYVYSMDAIPTRPEKHRARDLAVVGGGIAANASVAVARLGGHAMLATRLGDDFTAHEIVADLEREGVDCTFARRLAGKRSPVSAILVDAQGERLVVSYADQSYPAGTEWLPAALPAGTAGVLGDTRWEEGAAHVFALARRAGVPGVLDADRAPRHPESLRLASHIAFSAQGLRELTGTDDPRAGLERLAADAGNWLAVTLGAEGVLFVEDGRIVHEPTFPVTAVDTLGAGDVWHGALALALGEGMPARRAVRFASAAAALKCTRFGGRRGAPSRTEVERLLTERE